MLSALRLTSYLQVSLPTVCVSAYLVHNSLSSSVREAQLANLAQFLIGITSEAYQTSKVSKIQRDNTDRASHVEIDKIYKQFIELLV